MNSATEIKLYNLAQKKFHQADNPAIVSSIDNAIAELFPISQLDAQGGYLGTNTFDNILQAVFGEDSHLIPNVCLNPSRFWLFCDRFAYLSNQGKSQECSTVQATIEAIRNDNCHHEMGQQRFLAGIADATIIVHLTANGFLLWDSQQYKMVQCPLHWRKLVS